MDISLNSSIYKYTNLLFGYQERYFKISNGTVREDAPNSEWQRSSGAIYYYLSREGECRRFRTLTSKNFKMELDKGDPCKLELIFCDGEIWNLRFKNAGEMVMWYNALQAFLIASSEHANPPKEANTSSSSRSSPAFECGTSRCDADEVQEGPTEAEIDPLLQNIGNEWRDLTRLLRTGSSINGEGIKVALKRVRHMENELHSLKMTLKSMREAAVESEARVSVQELAPMSNEEETWEDASEHLDACPPVIPNGNVPAAPPTEESSTTVNGNIPTKGEEEPRELILPGLQHPLIDEVRSVAGDQLKYALASTDGGLWELFVKDGEMRMYKMETEVNGIAVDPLKAVHSVKGVSAREYINCFFDPSLKREWDDTVVNVQVVDHISEDFAIIQQLHRRIWPTSARESLFWSTRANVSEQRETGFMDAWMVCNHSLEHYNIPVDGGKTPADVELTRDDVSCRIYYVAEIHPGGWVPSAGLRQVYKKEFPKFVLNSLLGNTSYRYSELLKIPQRLH